jgi:hypothetical protein
MRVAEWLPALSAFISFIVGLAVGWRKAGPESEAIATQTLRNVIKELRLELDRKESEIQSMRSRLDLVDKHLSTIVDLPPGHLG